jgi:hypothetical protein
MIVSFKHAGILKALEAHVFTLDLLSSRRLQQLKRY